MKGHPQLYRVLNSVIGLGIVILLALMLFVFSQYIDDGWFYVSVESFQWIDISLWGIAVTSVVLLTMLFWLTLAFSFVAVVSAICVLSAMVMMFSGFSLVWPLILLLLAAWGVGQASHLD